MSDRPSRHGVNDQRVLGAGKNGMRINATRLMFAIDPIGDVPEVCSRCGMDLRGCAFDSPLGWLCSAECPAVLELWAEMNQRIDGTAIFNDPAWVPFSETGLDAPS